MKDDTDRGVTISAPILALLFGGVLTGGAGIGSVVQPAVESSALKACYDNSRIAIEQANSQGQIIDEISAELLSRTRDRHTATDHELYAKEHALVHARIEAQASRVEQLQDREIEAINDHISGHAHREE